MTLTPAIKGQLTKAIKAHIFHDDHAIASKAVSRTVVQPIFEKYMPRQQAKHAAKRYLAIAYSKQ